MTLHSFYAIIIPHESLVSVIPGQKEEDIMSELKLKITIELFKEGDLFISRCPELDMIAQGHSIDEAKANLLEVIEIQFEEMKEIGTLEEFLAEAGYQPGEGKAQSEKEIIGFEMSFVKLESVA